jgi:hypothetical protein
VALWCAWIFWLGLFLRAKVVGGAWQLAGLAYCAYKTNGFCERPLLLEFKEG